MPEYNIYPAVDSEYNFPPEIRQAATESIEFKEGVEAHLPASSIGTAADTLVLRDSNGRAYIETPTLDPHIANKEYVDNAALGANTAVGSTPDTIPIRDGNGRFYVGGPVFNGHVTTKGYVDNGDASVAASVPTIIQQELPNEIRDDESEFTKSMEELYQPRSLMSSMSQDQYRNNASGNILLNFPGLTLQPGVSYRLTGKFFITFESDNGDGAHPGIKFWFESTDTSGVPKPLTWTINGPNGNASSIGGFGDTLSVQPGVNFGQSGVVELDGFITMPEHYSISFKMGSSKNVQRNSNYTVHAGSNLVAWALPPATEYYNGRTISVGNITGATLQTPGKPWNFKYKNDLMRIELRNGDRWQGDEANSIGTSDNRERCEIAGPRYPNGTNVWFSYSFRYFGNIAEAQIGNDPYLFISQVLMRGNGPASALQFSNGGTRLVMSRSHVDPTTGKKIYGSGMNIPAPAEGEITHLVVNMITGVNDDATLRVWVNGVQEVDLTGINLGQEHPTNIEQPSFKFGQYRGQHERIVVEYANLSINTTGLSNRIDNPLAWPNVTW